jgi:exodeoxyribonuclease VII large subunit
MFPDTITEQKPLTVSEVTREIKNLLESAYPSIAVEGEISGFKKHGASGHIYFSLKDEQTILPAVIWRSSAQRLRFDPRDGMSVIAIGRLGVYEPQGKYQLYVDRLLPQGEGALEAAFRQLKEKLFTLGYFDPKRKRTLPKVPRRIAVITSPTGAAIRDILETLSRRWPAVEILVAPVRVQGAGAAAAIAAAIALVNRMHLGGVMTFDLLIVGRGGGSLEDLWAFNEEIVAEAIFTSQLVIVSGVGHETDLTIADLVADIRALTPTAAAMLVVPDRLEILESLQVLAGRLRSALFRRVEVARQRLDELRNRRPFRLPRERVHELSRRLDDFADRLHRRRPLERVREVRDRLSGFRERLDRAVRQIVARGHEANRSFAARLEALSPLNVLGRGYSLTATVDGALLRSSDPVRPGDRLTTRLARGRIVSRVESVELEPPAGATDE